MRKRFTKSEIKYYVKLKELRCKPKNRQKTMFITVHACMGQAWEPTVYFNYACYNKNSKLAYNNTYWTGKSR